MALTNAVRQARHRERMKAKLACGGDTSSPSAAPREAEPLRNEDDAQTGAMLDAIRSRFEDGMIELLDQGDCASDLLDAIREPRQAAIDRFHALGKEGQWRLLMAGLREAGHAAVLRIVEDCHAEWNRQHPRVAPPPPQPAAPVKRDRRRVR